MGIVGVLFLYWGLSGEGLLNYVAALAMGFFAVRFLSTTRVQSRPVSGVDEHLAAGGVVVYWRPGCQYCARLVRELGPQRRGIPYWVNIWHEDEAAARVRQYNGGNETVPTVVSAEEHFVARDRQTFERALAVTGRARRAA